MLRIAQKARNYKLAIQFLNEDIFKLDKQPDIQIYEVQSIPFLETRAVIGEPENPRSIPTSQPMT
jgi:hypothetical protein